MKRVCRLLIAPALLLVSCFFTVSRADLDGPAPVLSGGAPSGTSSNDDLQIVCALLGGDKGCADVTENVRNLLNSTNGFSAKDLSSDGGSLIILYNYGGHRHYFARSYHGPKVSLGLLKEAAKIDDTAAAEAPLKPVALTPGDSIHVIFAAYGAHEMFWDVTDIVAKPLETAGGIDVNTDSMGGDPEWGSGKYIFIVYDYDGERHVFARSDGGPIAVDSGELIPDKKKSNSSRSYTSPTTSGTEAPVDPMDPNYKPFGR